MTKNRKIKHFKKTIIVQRNCKLGNANSIFTYEMKWADS